MADYEQAVEHNTRDAAELLTVKSEMLASTVEAGTLKNLWSGVRHGNFFQVRLM